MRPPPLLFSSCYVRRMSVKQSQHEQNAENAMQCPMHSSMPEKFLPVTLLTPHMIIAKPGIHVQGDPSGRIVGSACSAISLSAQAEPGRRWNRQNQSQPNLGIRPDGPPCRKNPPATLEAGTDSDLQALGYSVKISTLFAILPSGASCFSFF